MARRDERQHYRTSRLFGVRGLPAPQSHAPPLMSFTAEENSMMSRRILLHAPLNPSIHTHLPPVTFRRHGAPPPNPADIGS
jgi:hypothetical protein